MSNPDSIIQGAAQIKYLDADLTASVVTAPSAPPTVVQTNLPLGVRQGMQPFEDGEVYNVSICYISMNTTKSLEASAFSPGQEITQGEGDGLQVTVTGVPAGIPYIGVAVNNKLVTIHPTDDIIYSANTGTFTQNIPVFGKPATSHPSLSELNTTTGGIRPVLVKNLGLYEDGFELSKMMNGGKVEIAGHPPLPFAGVSFFEAKFKLVAFKNEVFAYFSGGNYFAGDSNNPTLLYPHKLTSSCSGGVIFKVIAPCNECGLRQIVTFYGAAVTTEDFKMVFKNNEATMLDFSFSERGHPIFAGMSSSVIQFV